MYQALIVDDEVRDRNIIKILLERKYRGEFHISEAENGPQALEILQREPIQLLLLDINMPGMSGLDVLRRLNTVPYVIVLTAYSSFAYTREALRCGVQDYLLKPPLREEFYRSIEQFRRSRSHIEESVIQLRSRELFTRDLAQQLMYYGDQKKIQGLLDVLNMPAGYAACGIFRCRLAAGADVCYLLDEAEEVLSRIGAAFAAEACSEGIAVFLFSNTGEMTADFVQTYTRLGNHLMENLSAEVSTHMGEMLSVAAYPKAYAALSQTPEQKNGLHISQELIAQVETALRDGQTGTALSLVCSVLESAEGSRTLEMEKFELTSILTLCTAQLLEGKSQKEAYARIGGLVEAKNREQLLRLTGEFFQLLRVAQGPEHAPCDAVQSALGYVREDCSKAWTIETLAGLLHINAYYLSHLFKENMGRCFTDYLAEQRIDRAVELMRAGGLNCTQISERVGYSDPNYFSRVFKKYKGCGPREFSRNLRASGRN
jgi:two-component system response regulator YesN